VQRRPQLLKAAQGAEIAQAMMDGCYSTHEEVSPVALERSLASLRAIFELSIEPSHLTNHATYENITLWELLLQRLCCYKPTAHVWAAIRVMLENGAGPPTWEYKQLKGATYIELKVGERRLILREHSLEGWDRRYIPDMLRHNGATATLKDFMVMHGVYNTDILQLLARAEAEVNKVAEEVAVVEKSEAVSDRLESIDNGSSTSSLLANSLATTRNIADLFLKSPVLPWTIVGE
jgi:hypothetical protein